MSDFKINSIATKQGQHGPVIAGVSTINSTGCMKIPSGPTENRGGRGRGVIGSGQNIPSGVINTMNLITIATAGNAIDFGDLSYGQAYRGGLASSTRGIFVNGQSDATFDFVTISSQGGANDFGEALSNHMGGATFNSSTRGFRAGGADPSHTSNIMGMVIASTGSFYDAGDLTKVGTYQNGASSPTRGIIFGGTTPSASYNNIDVFTMASGGNATKFGELSAAKKYVDTSGNTIRGLSAGGSPSNNVIEFVTIATEGNAQDFGDLHSATNTGKNGSVSSATRGIFSGFYPAQTARMDFVTIMSAGNAQDFGDMTATWYYMGGCSDSNGGIDL